MLAGLLAGWWVLTVPRAAASCGVVVAQGCYLLHVYVPMPPPRGDTFGFERWNGAGAAHRSQPAGGEPAGAAHRPGDAQEGSASIAAGAARRRTRNVLIIGDSLVVGIGCKDRMVLPQGICRQISDLLQVDISWRAVGVNGGDVRTIKQEVLETVKRFQRERELRYQEYLASLDAAPGAQAHAAMPAGEALAQRVPHGSARGPGGPSSGAPSVPASPSAAKRQQLLRQHLDAGVPQETPPHLRGAGAALFDFVRTHPYLKRGEHGGAGSGDTWSTHGDVTRDAGRNHGKLISEPSPKVDAVIVLCGLNDLKRILRGRTSTDFHDDLDRLVTEVRAQVGQECVVILPAMPMEQTNLPQPLRSGIVCLCVCVCLVSVPVSASVSVCRYMCVANCRSRVLRLHAPPCEATRTGALVLVCP